MKWNKKGLIYNAHDFQETWAKDSALTPTPILLNPDVIRVYFGARDAQGVSRIRFADLNAHNPSEIIKISSTPALDVGEPGAFDDNGVILGDVIDVNGQLHLFYVGFQLVSKAKFLAFSGMAVSHDGGNTFTRVMKTPILDRSDEGLFIRAIHTVIYENGLWRIWYAAGKQWTYIEDQPYPNYHINYIECNDILNLPKQGHICIEHINDEYRIGRPRVYKNGIDYSIYYTKGEINGSYLPGFAQSSDGIIWQRKDQLVGLSTSKTGWDSQTVCYPSLLTTPSDVTYLFYNGNAMGKDGFGYAELSHD